MIAVTVPAVKVFGSSTVILRQLVVSGPNIRDILPVISCDGKIVIDVIRAINILRYCFFL